MTASIVRNLACAAGFALLIPAIPAFASSGAVLGSEGKAVRAANTQVAAVECMLDDGYGRKRPCGAFYKKENPGWRGGDQCYTDDGYGRYRSCSANYKAKHAKDAKGTK